MRAAAFSCRGS